MSPPRALLVEDDEDDAFMMRRACEGLLALERVADGGAALARLRPGTRSAAGLPALVLLDWRLPGLSGEEVLRGLRADPSLRLLPVLVLTTSGAEADANAAYAAGANAFLTKPTGGEPLKALAAAIAGFWLRPELIKITPRGA